MIRVGLTSGTVITYENGNNAAVYDCNYLTIFNKDNIVLGQFKDWTK